MGRKGTGMTENEAIALLYRKRECITDNFLDYRQAQDTIDMCDMAIKALKEIQRYKAIGLTPELVEAMQGHNIAMINDLGEYQQIGTAEEFKDLKEKSVAKKPRFYAHNYYCTECGNLVGNNEFEWQRFLYCDNCGQKLDWQ